MNLDIINLDINKQDTFEVIQLNSTFFSPETLQKIEENAEFKDTDESLGEVMISMGRLLELSTEAEDDFALLHEKLTNFCYIQIVKI